MFHNPLLIGLTVLGANLPDFDHDFKRNNVLVIFILGLAVSILLYFLNLPYYLGLIFVGFGFIFLFSKHRGFTHSILGCLVLGFLLFCLLYCILDLSLFFGWDFSFGNLSTKILVLFVFLAFLSVFFLNKRLCPIYIMFIVFSCVLINFGVISSFKLDVVSILFSIFLGLFSHMVLDSFTPSGIKPFVFITHKKFHKKFGLLLLVILILVYFIFFKNYSYFYVNILNDFML